MTKPDVQIPLDFQQIPNKNSSRQDFFLNHLCIKDFFSTFAPLFA